MAVQKHESRPQTPPNVKVGEARERVGSKDSKGISWPIPAHPDMSKMK